MHTYRSDSGITYRYNGDFSGDIGIIPDESDLHTRVAIPLSDIRELYLEYIRNANIRRLEQATPDEIERFLTIILPLSEVTNTNANTLGPVIND